MLNWRLTVPCLSLLLNDDLYHNIFMVAARTLSALYAHTVIACVSIKKKTLGLLAAITGWRSL
jgi:hypothetical protein